jgi:regulatory protein
MRRSQEDRKALASAYRLLKQRPRSRAEISRHLERLEFDADTISRTLDSLVSFGEIDDRAFASAWTDSRMRFRPRSKWLIRRELEDKGIDAELAQNATEDIDDYHTAREIARHRANQLQGLDRTTFTRRLMRYLVSRGYDRGTSARVVIELLSEDSSS